MSLTVREIGFLSWEGFMWEVINEHGVRVWPRAKAEDADAIAGGYGPPGPLGTHRADCDAFAAAHRIAAAQHNARFDEADRLGAAYEAGRRYADAEIAEQRRRERS